MSTDVEYVIPNRKRVWLATRRDVQESGYMVLDCYCLKVKSSLILVSFLGKCYGYLNKCVHMPFRLDCEDSNIMDQSRRYLKCSMHGIIYDPASGKSLSPTLCPGVPLTAVNLWEDELGVWLADDKVSLSCD